MANPEMGPRESEGEKQIEISEAKNFDELFLTIEQKGGIVGNDGKEYTLGELIDKVEGLRDTAEKTFYKSDKKFDKETLRKLIRHEMPLARITRTEGLRNKISDLLVEEAFNLINGVKQEIKPNEDMVAKNLAMFNNDMQQFLGMESFGGNAGDEEIGGEMYNCGGANGCINPRIGEIIVFSNYSGTDTQIDPKIIKNSSEFILRVAAMPSYYKILSFHHGKRLTKQATENINEAIKRYNSYNDVELEK